jgi:hypothetical protein
VLAGPDPQPAHHVTARSTSDHGILTLRGAMEPRRTDYIPPVDDAVALPTPELAMRLLAYLAAFEDHYGGYGVPFSALQLHPDAVASAGTWPEHTDGQHHELFLRAISEAWAWLVANGLLARWPGGGGTQEVFVTRTSREVAAQPDGLARLQAEQRLSAVSFASLSRSKLATRPASPRRPPMTSRLELGLMV